MQLAVVLLLIAIAFTECAVPYDRKEGFGYCLKKKDGSYSLGCISQFVTCTKSVSFVMSCRPGFYFDKVTNKCAPKSIASSCNNKVQSDDSKPTRQFTPFEPEKSKFCEIHKDGDYNIGCTSVYISCVGPLAYAMECPPGLVLDQASQSCVERAYVAVCGGHPTTTTTTTTTTPTTTTTTPTTTTTTPTTTTTTQPPASEPTTPKVKPCRRPFGFFTYGCSSQYFVCIDGHPFYYDCPHGLKFDESVQLCRPEKMVRPCWMLSGEKPKYMDVPHA